ncbi:hypothetical protein I79_018620 [Cricetulus griseus]|uniref:Uncharacterized protein n=1 Tax=Cricetulus griseus TaxID=10029 RepID=G3I576_CRIGR|nr:hypothetical protein I79_018620 [Cricetulus griseus]
MALACEHIGTLTTHHCNIITKIKAVSTGESRKQRAKTKNTLAHTCCQACSPLESTQ